MLLHLAPFRIQKKTPVPGEPIHQSIMLWVVKWQRQSVEAAETTFNEHGIHARILWGLQHSGLSLSIYVTALHI